MRLGVLAVIAVAGCFHEAHHTPLPEVVNSGGPVLSSPRWAIITFAGDPLGDAINAFTTKLASSSYWKTVVGEYGVGPATVIPVKIADAPPATIDDAGIQTLIAAHLDPLAQGWPAVGPNTVYVAFFTSATTVTGYCTAGPLAYHSQLVAPNGTQVPYVVIPRCAYGLDPLDTVTYATTHELAEASTDPLLQSAPAYLSTADYAWSQLAIGSEIGDMCENSYGAYIVDAELGAYVQRIWSNAAAAAGHDPCVPQPSGDVYFQAAPDLPDMITIPSPLPTGAPVTTRGIKVPVGSTRTIDLDVFSDQSTAPISVFVNDWPINPTAEQPAGITFALDRPSGTNGDKLHLTINVVADTAGEGHEYFIITSQLGDVQHYWPVVVGN